MVELQDEAALIDAARRDNEDAFRGLVEPYSRDLQLLCYRMLGSFLDAEDAKQETLLKAWRGIGSYDGRASVRTWLCRIATNTCLDMLRSRQRRVLPVDMASPITSSWTEPSNGASLAWTSPGWSPIPTNTCPPPTQSRSPSCGRALVSPTSGRCSSSRHASGRC